MRKWLSILVVSMILPLASNGTQFRTKCCHGCGSYYCNEKKCGSDCHNGPSCRGCWKDCVR